MADRPLSGPRRVRNIVGISDGPTPDELIADKVLAIGGGRPLMPGYLDLVAIAQALTRQRD